MRYDLVEYASSIQMNVTVPRVFAADISRHKWERAITHFKELVRNPLAAMLQLVGQNIAANFRDFRAE